MNMNLGLIAHVTRNTCAIGFQDANFKWEDLPPNDKVEDMPVHVVGTGFLIAPHILVTARHVTEHLLNRGVEWNRIIAVFIDHIDPKNFAMKYVRHLGAIALSNSPKELITPKRWDYTFIAMDDHLYPQRNAPHPPLGLVPIDPERVRVGMPICVLGYYAGQGLLKDPGLAAQRFGPVLLSGHVAAISPAGIVGGNDVTEYLLDVTAAGGVSGAPVVCANTGQLLGMARGGVERPIANTSIPLDLAFALPLTPRHIATIQVMMAKNFHVVSSTKVGS